MNIKHTLILLSLLLLASCGANNAEETARKSEPFKVAFAGALKNMMHKGDVSAKIDLKDFENVPNFYALGALENLKGEVQIWNGESFNTTVADSALRFDKSFNKKATLLVYASVSQWRSVAIPNEVVTYEQLEHFIENAAAENKIPTNEPFPFLLEGTAKSFDWHVINWKDGDTEHSHEKHINSGLNGTVKNTEVEMLGFYSDAHHAIFTHHTTNMHIHMKTADNKFAGHVDGLELGKGMTLKLPLAE